QHAEQPRRRRTQRLGHGAGLDARGQLLRRGRDDGGGGGRTRHRGGRIRARRSLGVAGRSRQGRGGGGRPGGRRDGRGRGRRIGAGRRLHVGGRGDRGGERRVQARVRGRGQRGRLLVRVGHVDDPHALARRGQARRGRGALEQH